jgi:hypothetical protein
MIARVHHLVTVEEMAPAKKAARKAPKKAANAAENTAENGE